MNTFLEGVEAVRLPCTLALLVPALAVALASGPRRPWVLAGFGLGATAVIWARFADVWFASPATLTLVIAGLAVVGAAVALFRLQRTQVAWAPALGATVGAITGWLWRPCVGEHLGSIINRAPDARLGTLVPTAIYILGVLILAIGVALMPAAFPRARAAIDHRRTRVAGLGLAVTIGLTIAVGWYEDIVAELFRRSSI